MRSLVALLAFPLVIALSGAFVGCVLPTNPYDPGTPREGQQPGLVTGTVLALREPVDGVRAPGLCALKKSDVPGDHSGFVIALRPLADDPELGVGVETDETNGSGQFQLQNVPPGRYSFEVFADGFLVPAPTEITVDIGATVTRTLCALDAQPPAVPTLAPLAEIVDVDDEVAISVLAPERGATYTITETPAGDDVTPTITTIDAATVDALPEGAPLVVPVGLGLGAAARTAWLVEVTAADAMGNGSGAAQKAIVRDGLAPAAPANVRASAALDRVFVSFDPAPASAEDDGAAEYLVSYAVAARPEDPLAACPFGAPFDATPDDAFFAVEGPSPVATLATQQTLSGLTPGTELLVYVAAVDAAGNVGCFSPPVRARPDVVTFARTADRGPSVAGAGALVFLGGSTGGVGAGGYAVAGANGSLVVDALGTPHALDDVESTDVALAGDTLVFASGLLGVTAVPLDRAGAPGTPANDAAAGNTARVAGEPGLTWAASAGGLFAVSSTGATQQVSGDFSAVAVAGALALGVRTAAGGFELAAFARDGGGPPLLLLDAVAFDRGALSAAVVGEHFVIVDDAGVRAISFAACLDAVVAGACLAESAARALPAGETAATVAALDDVALVGSAQGSVFALALPDLRPLGRVELGAPVRALAATDLGFCAAVDGVGAGEPVVACATVASFPLQEGEARAPTAEPAIRVAHAGGRVVAGAGALLVSAPLGDLGAARVDDLGVGVVDVAAFGTAGLALLEDGRVFVARAGRAPQEIADAASALPPGADFPLVSGFLVVAGADLYVAARALTGDAVLARASLATGVDGTVRVTGAVDPLQLPEVDQVTDLLVHAGRAYVASAPLGLFAVDVAADGGLALGADSALPVASDVSFAAAAVLTGVGESASPTVSVLAPTRSDAGADGFHSLGDGALVGVPSATPAGISGAVRAGRFLAVTTFGSGAFLLTGHDAAAGLVVPVLALPGVADVQEGAVTARGLVFADGAGGIARVLLR